MKSFNIFAILVIILIASIARADDAGKIDQEKINEAKTRLEQKQKDKTIADLRDLVASLQKELETLRYQKAADDAVIQAMTKENEGLKKKAAEADRLSAIYLGTKPNPVPVIASGTPGHPVSRIPDNDAGQLMTFGNVRIKANDGYGEAIGEITNNGKFAKSGSFTLSVYAKDQSLIGSEDFSMENIPAGKTRSFHVQLHRVPFASIDSYKIDCERADRREEE